MHWLNRVVRPTMKSSPIVTGRVCDALQGWPQSTQLLNVVRVRKLSTPTHRRRSIGNDRSGVFKQHSIVKDWFLTCLSEAERDKNTSRLWRILEHKSRSGQNASHQQLQSLLHLHVSLEDYGGALATLSKMAAMGVITVEDFSVLLKEYATRGDGIAGQALMGRLKACKLEPDVNIYNLLLQALARANDDNAPIAYFGRENRINAIIKRMREDNMEIHSSTYSALLNYYASQKNREAIEKVSSEMEQKELTPDFAAFSALLDASLSMQDSVYAGKILSKMCELGYCPNISQMNKLAKIYGQQNDVEKLHEILSLMLDLGYMVELTPVHNP